MVRKLTTVNLTLTALLETGMWEAKGKGAQLRECRHAKRLQ